MALKIKEDAINLHRSLRGKTEIHNRFSIDAGIGEEKGTLGLIYTPGVAHVAEEISKNKELVYDYTSKWNNVAIVCDGTRVLGLGNIGPGARPVMEGKSVLFKVLGGINAIPPCISTQNKEEIIKFVKYLSYSNMKTNIRNKNTNASSFPTVRLRRLRKNTAIRELLQELHLSARDLICPLFIEE
jgi:malate dehydrogenase (oxaloacetate-decarboxylating)